MCAHTKMTYGKIISIRFCLISFTRLFRSIKWMHKLWYYRNNPVFFLFYLLFTLYEFIIFFFHSKNCFAKFYKRIIYLIARDLERFKLVKQVKLLLEQIPYKENRNILHESKNQKPKSYLNKLKMMKISRQYGLVSESKSNNSQACFLKFILHSINIW